MSKSTTIVPRVATGCQNFCETETCGTEFCDCASIAESAASLFMSVLSATSLFDGPQLRSIALSFWHSSLVRNFAKGYDATMTRFNLPEEHFRILSLDPDDDLVRLNYERHPLVRMVTDAVLNLLRSRKLLLY